MQAPLLRLLLDVGSEIPSRHAEPELSDRADLLGCTNKSMVRPSLPEPIGSSLGVVTKALLALLTRNLGALLILDIDTRSVPFDDPTHLIAQRLGAKQEPAIFAIKVPEAHFNIAPNLGHSD